MDEQIERKLAAILTLSCSTAHEPARIFDALAIDLERYLLHLTGDAHRDLDRVEYESDGDHAWYVGWGEGVRRLLLAVELHLADGRAHLALRATKGHTDIANAAWGQTGPDIGNSILVMRLLHVGICSFRTLGFNLLTNDPYNTRLRQLYTSFGFDNGERLALDDSASLTTALTRIAGEYQRFNLALAAPPP